MGLLCWFGIALVSAALARSRGRSFAAWFGIGLLFSCLAPILVLVLPDLQAEAEREETLDRERERLQETLRLERQRAAAFRRQARWRLDAHDAALGLDTGRLAAGEVPELPLRDGAGAAAPAGDWFLAEPGGEPEGPMDEARLRARAEELGPERILVWREGMAGWVPFLQRDGGRAAPGERPA